MISPGKLRLLKSTSSAASRQRWREQSRPTSVVEAECPLSTGVLMLEVRAERVHSSNNNNNNSSSSISTRRVHLRKTMHNNHLHSHPHNLLARHQLTVAPTPIHLHATEPATSGGKRLGQTTTDATNTPKRWPACTHNMYTMFNGIKKMKSAGNGYFFLPASITMYGHYRETTENLATGLRSYLKRYSNRAT